MSEKQLLQLLARLSEDAELTNKLWSAADLDAALSVVRDAGFDVSKEECFNHQARQGLKLGDAEVESVAGGQWSDGCTWGCDCLGCGGSLPTV